MLLRQGKYAIGGVQYAHPYCLAEVPPFFGLKRKDSPPERQRFSLKNTDVPVARVRRCAPVLCFLEASNAFCHSNSVSANADGLYDRRLRCAVGFLAAQSTPIRLLSAPGKVTAPAFGVLVTNPGASAASLASRGTRLLDDARQYVGGATRLQASSTDNAAALSSYSRLRRQSG